jgi:hypothetical protein
MSTLPASDLASLNRDIARLETDAARIEIERTAAARATARLGRQHRYLRLARWFRSPHESFALYPLAVFAIAPLVVGVAVMVLASLIFSSWGLAFNGLMIGVLLGAIVFAVLLYWPANTLLPSALAEAETKLRTALSTLEDRSAALSDVNAQLAKLLDERRALATGEKLQRAMLLQRNWKAMQGAEWEDFIVEVCRTLGANVHRGHPAGLVPPPPPGSGARGVVRRPVTPLFVTFSPRRFALAAISEIRPFHTAAVQQIVGELAHHGCDALVIITNTRVTTGSKELARSRNCTLIGEDEFPDFVLGSFKL